MAKALRELFAIFKTKFDDSQLKRGDKQVTKTKKNLQSMDSVVDNITGSLKALGGALVAAVGVGAIVGFTKSTFESTQELMRWSARLNMSITELAGWTGAAAQFGASTDDVTDGLKELQLKAQDAITGGTSQAEMFERIGISLNDLKPVVNDSSKLMELFTRKLEKVNDEGLRNFTVDELMSDAGTRLLPFFKQGAKAITKMRRASEKRRRNLQILAPVQSKFNRTMATSKFQLEAMATSILLKVLPPVTKFAEKAGNIIEVLGAVVMKTNLFKAALITLGGIAVAFAISTIGIWGPLVLAAAAIIIVVLAIEDLITAFKGGESMIGDFLNAIGLLYDEGPVGDQFFEGMKKGWESLFGPLDEGEKRTHKTAQAFDKLWTSGEKGKQAAAIVLASVDIIKQGFVGLWAILLDYFSFLGNTWWPGIAGVISSVIGAFQSYISFLTDTWWPGITGVVDSVIGVFQSFWSFLTDTWWPGIAGVFDSFISAIQSIWSFAGKITGISSLLGIDTESSTPSPTPTQTTTLPTTAIASAQGAGQVNAPLSVGNITINGVTDPQEVGRIVDGKIRTAQERQARDLQGALVPS